MEEMIRILYVDDNPMDRALVRDILENSNSGLQITEAASENDFHALIKQQEFDVVLSDFNILGFEGLDVLDIVKENQPNTPVIIVTGTGSESIAVESMKRGASDYIIKTPHHISKLPTTIEHALEMQRIKQEKETALQNLKMKQDNIDCLISSSPCGILVIDKKGKILFTNEMTEKIFDKSAELILNEMLGLPSDNDKFELSIPKKDGSIGVIEVKSAETMWENKPAQLLIFNDITNYQNAIEKLEIINQKLQEKEKLLSKNEETLKAELEKSKQQQKAHLCLLKDLNVTMKESNLREKHLRSIVENPVGYAIYRHQYDRTTGEFEVIQISPNFKELLGISTEDKHHFKKWFKHLHPDDYSKLMKAKERGMKPPFKFATEIRFFHPSLGLRWLDIRSQGFSYEDDPNTKEFTNGIIIDITDKKKAENELKRNEILLRSSVESPVDMIILSLDENYRYLYFNKAHIKVMEAAYGKTPELGKCIFDYITSEDDIQKIKEQYAKGLKGVSNVSTDIYGDKEKRYYEIRINPILNDKEIIGITSYSQDITERKIVQEKLAESEERYRELVDTVNSGVAIYKVINEGKTGSNYIIQDFNKFALKHEKMEKENVVGKSLKDIRPNIDEYGLIDVFRKVWETGESMYFPAKVYIDEKYSNYYENRVFRLSSGEIVAIYDDVTNRETARLELKENEAKLKNIIENSTNIYFTHSTDRKITFISPQIKEILGYEPEEVLADWTNFITDNPINIEAIEYTEKAIKTGERQPTYELEMLHKNGKKIIFEVRESPVVENGLVTSIVGSLADITERKKAEEDLLLAKDEADKNSRLLSTLINAIPDLIWLKDNDGVYLNCNKRFEDFFGKSESEIVGKTDYDFVSKEQADFFREHDKIAMEAGKPTKNEEEITFASDGHSEILETIKTPLVDKNDKIIGVLGVGRDITNRKKSENETNAIFNTAADGMRVVGTDFIIKKVNDTFCKMVNLSREEILGKNCYDIFWGEFCDTEDCPLNKLMKNKKEKLEFEIVKRRPDGKEIPTLKTSTLFKDEHENVVGIIEDYRDMTDYKKAEDKLKESEARFRKLVETTSEGFWLIDLSKKTVDVNQSLCKMLGYTKDEIIDKTPFDFTDEENKEIMKEQTSKITQTVHRSYELILKKKDGTNVPVIFSATTLSDESGNPTGSFAFVTDISDRIKAEEELKESELKYKTIVECSIQGLVIAQADPVRLSYASTPMEDITGFTVKELVTFGPEQLNELIYIDDRKRFFTNFQYRLDRKEIKHRAEYRLVHKNGSIRWVELFSSLIEFKGKPATQTVFVDISERKKAEEEIKRKERDLRSLIENPAGYVVYRTRLNRETGQIEVILVSPSFSEVLGIPQEEVNDFSKWFTYVYQEDLPVLLKANEEGTRPPFKFYQELRYNHPEKGLRWLEIRSTGIPYDDDPNLIEYANGMILDITKRKKAEEDLVESEKKFRMLAENSVDCIWQMDLRLNFTYISPSILPMFGFTQEEWIGTNLSAHATRKEFFNMARRALGTLKNYKKVNHIIFEAEMLKKNGDTIPVEISGRVISNKYGLPVALQGATRDITERKIAQDKIKKSLDEKIVLLQEIYHRTKNNMQLISSMLRIRSRKLNDEIDRQIFLDIISKIRAMALVHEKLYKSKNLSMINLKTYLPDLTKQIGQAFGRSEITISANSEDIYVKIDSAVPLALILSELITNSYKYAFPEGKKGKISIESYQKEDTIHVIIQDNGIGLAENVDLGGKRSMGLHTVYSLGEGQLKGKIEYENNSGLKWHLSFKDNLYRIRV